jgi:hypothetical protein
MRDVLAEMCRRAVTAVTMHTPRLDNAGACVGLKEARFELPLLIADAVERAIIAPLRAYKDLFICLNQRMITLYRCQ